MGPILSNLDNIARILEGLTRIFVALALTYGFIRLAFVKEVSGDSFTNVFFVVIGFLFGKVAEATTRKAGTAPTPPAANNSVESKAVSG